MRLDLTTLPGLMSALGAAIPGERWFSDKGRQVVHTTPQQVVWIESGPQWRALVRLGVGFADGMSATYHVGLTMSPAGQPAPNGTVPPIWTGPVPGSELPLEVRETLGEPDFVRALLLVAASQPGLDGLHLTGPEPLDVGSIVGQTLRPLAVEQSNHSLVLAEELLIKVFRRAWPGTNPEVEMLTALNSAGFQGISQPLAVLEVGTGAEATTLALLQRYLPNGTEAFTLALTSIRDLEGDLLLEADGEMPAPEATERAVIEQGASFLPAARELGHLVAGMHRALASAESGLVPPSQPLEPLDLEMVASQALERLDALVALPEPRLEPLRVREQAVRLEFERLTTLPDRGKKIRIHGDLHLGQLLRTDEGWHVLDFEGRPIRPPEERRQPASPLQDVAGMLRSFDYAAAVGLRQQVHPDEIRARTLAPYGHAWSEVMRRAFWDAYLEEAGPARLLPASASARGLLITSLQLSQALYEIDYELHSRPDWLEIPLEGVARLLGGGTS